MEEARQLVQSAKRIAVLTGAGISAESGVPTFRSGPDGLWNRRRPEELATPEAFAREPKLVWEWYDWRRTRIAAAEPNAGHRALADLERRAPETAVITQNVDGLHERAGTQNVTRLHGSIWVVRCGTCGREREDARASLPLLPPRCECGGLQRPGVVWFGEALPEREWDRAQAAAWRCDLLLVVGTSASVYPAAMLAPLAQSNGRAKVIEINTEETPLSGRATLSLRGQAGDLLPALLS